MTHNAIEITDGPGSELIILSLHCLLRGERAPIVKFEIAEKVNISVVITGIDMSECIEGASVSLKGGYAMDVSRFCPQRDNERKGREFVFSNYNHHSRKGFLQIPSAYLAQIRKELEV